MQFVAAADEACIYVQYSVLKSPHNNCRKWELFIKTLASVYCAPYAWLPPPAHGSLKQLLIIYYFSSAESLLSAAHRRLFQQFSSVNQPRKILQPSVRYKINNLWSFKFVYIFSLFFHFDNFYISSPFFTHFCIGQWWCKIKLSLVGHQKANGKYKSARQDRRWWC